MDKKKEGLITPKAGRDVLDKVGAAILTPIALLLIAARVIYMLYEQGGKGLYTPKGTQSGRIHSGWKGE